MLSNQATPAARGLRPWNDVATAIDSEITLIDQTRAKEFEYRVIAINKAGQGQPSDRVMVVL